MLYLYCHCMSLSGKYHVYKRVQHGHFISLAAVWDWRLSSFHDALAQYYKCTPCILLPRFHTYRTTRSSQCCLAVPAWPSMTRSLARPCHLWSWPSSWSRACHVVLHAEKLFKHVWTISTCFLHGTCPWGWLRRSRWFLSFACIQVAWWGTGIGFVFFRLGCFTLYRYIKQLHD